MPKLDRALRRLEEFALQRDLTPRISGLERDLAGRNKRQLTRVLDDHGVDASILDAALMMKGVVGQIDVIIHAVGILVSLPHLLNSDERIVSLSLGAGNTGREFDLETDQQVAEFKFIQWRGGPESIRQNQLFYDFFKLAEEESARRHCLYVLGKEHPMRFLKHNRALKSVLSKNEAVRDRFRGKYGDSYSVVSQYFDLVQHKVEIIDLSEFVPGLSSR